jgi:exopolyphosphatase/guanosine-5'-triphosphate,3'-diphosphate pyrophosphatase
MARFAAIDVGSNASRLLIVDADKPGSITALAQLRAPVRLGHSVFLTGRLDPDAIDQAVASMHAFRAAMKQHGVAPSSIGCRSPASVRCSAISGAAASS